MFSEKFGVSIPVISQIYYNKSYTGKKYINEKKQTEED